MLQVKEKQDIQADRYNSNTHITHSVEELWSILYLYLQVDFLIVTSTISILI